MKIKEMLEIIIEKGKTENMIRLNEMLDELICDLKGQRPNLFREYKKELMGMAYNHNFTKDMAMEIVNNMKPYGEVWNYDTTSEVKRQYNVQATDIDFYIVMNSMINDYYKIIDKEDIETYARLSNAFINDEDAIRDKVWEYFCKIPKED